MGGTERSDGEGERTRGWRNDWGEELGGELRDYWKEDDGQHESLAEKVRRLTRRIEGLERGRRREVGDGMPRGSSSESDESHGGWKRDGKAWWFKLGHQGTINSRLRRKISRAVKATIEQDATKRRDEWMQLKNRKWNGWRRRRGNSNRKQYRTWTLAGTREPGPSLLVKGNHDPNWGNRFM